MLSLDLNKFNFPFYFESYEHLKLYHSQRPLQFQDLVIKTDNNYRYSSFLNTWERDVCEEDPNPDPYYKDVFYKLNQDNFRGEKGLNEIGKDTNLCSGCSISFGMGVKQEDSWPFLAYGNSCINVSLPNASPTRIVRHLSGILDYKTPKSITILFSTIDRIDSFYKWEDSWKEIILSPGITRTLDRSLLEEDYKFNMYKNFVLGTNEAFNLNLFFFSLELLISKCKLKGIPLKLSSWEFELRNILKKYSSRGFEWFDIPTNLGRARDPFHPGYEFHRELGEIIRKSPI